MPARSEVMTRKIILLYNMDSSWSRADQKEVRKLVEKMLDGLQRHGYQVEPIEAYKSLDALEGYDPLEWLVFNWCEGFEAMPWSDHLVAKELEARGFAFTGSGSRILKNNLDKWRGKHALRAARVLTPPGRVMSSEVETTEWEYFPAIVKPVEQHSSIGITYHSVVNDRAALARQIRAVYGEFGQASLVEAFVDGREFHVAVWGNRKVEALPPVELDFSAFSNLYERIYTYDCKFVRGSRGMMSIDWHCPAPENNRLRAKIEAAAAAAYRAFGCRDYARMDVRLWNGRPMVVDLNTNPDLHPESVFPMAVEALGLKYGAMAARLVDLAMPRLKRKRTLQKSRAKELVAAI